tara:strand:- start:1364 stop:1768 length:405 start_codon:yes stop_codon:yes gene_type:complete
MEEAEHLLKVALNVTQGAGGETAVGAGAGLVAGWLLHRLQGTIFTGLVLGGLGTIGALHAGWIEAEQAQAAAGAAYRLVKRQVRRLDLNEDGAVDEGDSKIAASKIVPFVKSHPGEDKKKKKRGGAGVVVETCV